MEILDVVDETGAPTGETVERAEAHREGVRHRTAWHWFLRCHQRKCAVFVLCTQQHALGQYSGKFCRL